MARSFSRVASPGGAALAGSPGPRGPIRERPAAGQEQLEQALLRRVLGARPDLGGLLVAHQLDRDLDQVAHDRVDVAADVADLGELAGLDLEERRAREPGEPAGDLGLADAGRADHDDVLGRDLVAQIALDLLAAPPVAHRHGHRALGVALADHVAVELLDDLAGGQLRVVGKARGPG
jgi:hypothetical protein